jgi:hypothetical protein
MFTTRKEDSMRRPEIELLEDFVDESPALARWDLELPIDFTREDHLDDEDDLGFRGLYEHPEAVLRSSRWPDAA